MLQCAQLNSGKRKKKYSSQENHQEVSNPISGQTTKNYQLIGGDAIRSKALKIKEFNDASIINSNKYR